MSNKLQRGAFLRTVGTVSAGATLGLGGEAIAQAATPSAGGIPKRKFGRHPDMISILGLGGHHLGDVDSQADATAIVHEALDSGITFFDNAWEYNDHRSEEYLGNALVGRRDQAFLMTKVCTHGRDGALGMKMLEESLRRLHTDHLDVWQIHGISWDNDPALAYRKGGIIEALDKAKQMGKVRYVGFTGHKSPAIHQKMIDMGYPFDSVQMPINAFDATFRSFEQNVAPDATKRGIAILGMKPFNGTGIPFHSADYQLTPEEAMRYAMSVPGVVTTISGVETLALLRQNVQIARNFKPMTPAEMQALRVRLAPSAADGHVEPYKTSIEYDNIVAREVHGFPLNGAHP